MSDLKWTRWYDERPTDPNKIYRWRVSPRLILGMELQPEWSEQMSLCGMGYGGSEYWPLTACHWDGYNRLADPTLEWREALPDETEIKWNGLDLLPSPFTGKPPKVIFDTTYITAPPYKLEWIGIKSHMVDSIGWRDARAMQEAWNTRHKQGEG